MTESASWQLDGYRLDSLLGLGPHGAVWRGLRLSPRRAVAVKRLDARDASVTAEMRRRAAVIGALGSPYVVPIRDVVAATDSRPVMVMDYAAGGSLASLLEERGALTPPEVVTVLFAVATGLAAMHSHGLMHGCVGATNVVLSADGRPMLTDAGVTDAQQPADDVAALGRMCRATLEATSSAPALIELLEAASEGAICAAELASAALEVGPAAPLFASRSQPSVARRRAADQEPGTFAAWRGREHSEVRPRSGWLRRAVSAGVAVAGVAGAITAGSAWARHDAPAAATVGPAARLATPSSAAVDWMAVVASLESARDAALIDRQLTRLATVDEPRSAALSRDRALIAAMIRAGLRSVGLSSTVIAVHVVSVVGDAATLRVTDQVSPYELVDRHGHVVAHRPGRGPREFEMRLSRHADRWWLVLVRAAVSR